ncbi:transcription factor S [Halapricum hydrolyticum]|uniref:Transcription factor S n=1 Tax=Halapricum hydrolyticum TaxID=2979991 RepID=A0AAE3LIW8_9EURY|nr:transcription factor S [Halapricum hydrolyticum]MCU4719351.1 transcription factor S [Halapricum hydrolyticum]MCU4728384.1 transcription factor S [Halapricum hydrolyticum]
MEFCDECGSMMKTEGDVWVCSSCGAEKPRSEAAERQAVTTQGQQKSEVVDTSEVSSEDMGPTTEAQCPECDNDRAFWEMKQIRSADESETRFFTCTECGHKWREDDH